MINYSQSCLLSAEIRNTVIWSVLINVGLALKNLYWYSNDTKFLVEIGLDESRKENRIVPLVLLPGDQKTFDLECVMQDVIVDDYSVPTWKTDVQDYNISDGEETFEEEGTKSRSWKISVNISEKDIGKKKVFCDYQQQSFTKIIEIEFDVLKLVDIETHGYCQSNCTEPFKTYFTSNDDDDANAADPPLYLTPVARDDFVTKISSLVNTSTSNVIQLNYGFYALTNPKSDFVLEHSDSTFSIDDLNFKCGCFLTTTTTSSTTSTSTTTSTTSSTSTSTSTTSSTSTSTSTTSSTPITTSTNTTSSTTTSTAITIPTIVTSSTLSTENSTSATSPNPSVSISTSSSTAIVIASPTTSTTISSSSYCVISCGNHQNYCCILDQSLINKIDNDTSVTWNAKNSPAFKYISYQQAKNGWLGTVPPKFRFKRNQNQAKSNDLPRGFNSYNKWPGRIGPILDQEGLNISWALSSVSVLSDRASILYRIRSHIGLNWRPLLIRYCSKKGNNPCVKRYFVGWNYLRRYGTKQRSCNTRTCNMIYKSTPAILLPRNSENIKTEIFSSGPVQALIWVNSDLFLYGGGVYFPTQYGVFLGYHSVRIVGWGYEQGMDYWLVANSWGTEWGDRGLVKIKMSTCGIEDYVVTTRLDRYPDSPRRRKRKKI